MSEPIVLPDAAATRAYGQKLGAALRAHVEHCVLIGLSGELGAGKTSFAAGVLEANGVIGAIRSPTYTLIEPYELSVPTRMLYHLDLYRLRSPQELEDLGVRELLSGNNVLLVEWIENAPALAQVSDLDLLLRYHGERRMLLMNPRTANGETLASALTDQHVTVQRS